MKDNNIEVTGGYEVISQEQIQRIKSWWYHLDNYTEKGFIPDPVVPVQNQQLAMF